MLQGREPKAGSKRTFAASGCMPTLKPSSAWTKQCTPTQPPPRCTDAALASPSSANASTCPATEGHRGEGRKVGRGRAPDRMGRISRFFFCGRIICTRAARKRNETSTNLAESIELPRINNHIAGATAGEPGQSAEIQGISCSEQFPLFELPPLTTPCARCGAPFPTAKRKGRPKRFCSSDCRKAQASEQRRDWSMKNPVDSDPRPPAVCRQCGSAFQLQPRLVKAGRLPHFCSDECRYASLKLMEHGYRERRRRLRRGFREVEG